MSRYHSLVRIAPRAVVAKVRQIAERDPAVAEASLPRTMHLGRDVVHVDLDVRLENDLTAADIIDATHRIEHAACDADPRMRRVFVRLV